MSVKVSLKWIIGLLLAAAFVSVVSIIVRDFYKPSDEIVTHDEVSSVLISKDKQVFEPVIPNTPVVLPNDFGFHSKFQHEWWHFFANVKDHYGNDYGVQWSYFRIANDDNETLGWQNPQIYFSHIVVSSSNQVWKEQRIARGGIGQAGLNPSPYRIWIDNWAWSSVGQTPFPGHLDVDTDTFSVSLYSNTNGPYVLPGKNGFQKKHSELPFASYNIQAPFLTVQGQLHLNQFAKPLKVEGTAWMSKEWGSGLMAEGQQGWDWFVVNLNETTTLSVNRYRHQAQLPYLFGTLASTDGKVIALSSSDISMVPLSNTRLDNGHNLSLEWRITVPKYNIDLKTSVVNKKLWLPFVLPYWEGPVKTTGTHIAKGFMQLSGY